MKLFQLVFICFSLLMLTGCATEQAYAPTVRYYKGEPSCGIACYSNNPEGIYKLSSGPYLEGIIMIHGNYDTHICKPVGYETTDISTFPKFKKLCDTQIKRCGIAKKTAGKGCWADGDTGNLPVVLQ